MTSKMRIPGQELDNLTDALIEDLLAASDAEFLEEERASGRDLKAATERVRALVLKGSALAAKSKLREAKTAVAASRAKGGTVTPLLDPSRAREILKRLVANDPEFRTKLTLAARNENELSDEDILGIVEDLRDLGTLPDEDDWL
ncbi:hypothetical protein [Dechloromonas sp. H13]|uniref:hypothetical protein n=1 Tax=Dechloromonas sp. H13 TaxID=2570193 RepID=UPI00129256A9|nr:hypothetical protein [Dechloromonas sp. H13]